MALLFTGGCSPSDAGKPEGLRDSEESDTTPCLDADNDGAACDADCDDENAAVNPAADEVCDGVDNDCDGEIDNDASDVTTWYVDVDGDGYGEPGTGVGECAQPVGATQFGGDCDDSNPAINPGADEEDCTNPIDYNCDGVVAYSDNDGDGFAACDDCDDARVTVNASAIEICDGIDNDCDGGADEDDAEDASTWYADSDGDGFGDSAASARACAVPDAYVSVDTDCDDASAAVSPDAIEVCDGIDNNCDLEVDEEVTPTWCSDADGDGFGDPGFSTPACTAPAGHVGDCTDCDDADADTYPGAKEICADGVIADCSLDPEDAAEVCGLAKYLDLSAATAKIVGEEAGDQAGWPVSYAGDVNRDGYGDVLVGAPMQDSGGVDAGTAYLVLGPISGEIDLSAASARLIGETPEGLAGTAVSGAGDVNGDAYDDVLVGAPDEGSAAVYAGAAYLILGPIVGDVDLSDADVSFMGLAERLYTGISVSDAGDMNDDGLSDLLVGAYGQGPAELGDGAIYLVSDPGAGAYDLEEAEATIEGDSLGDYAGWSVSGAGDVDGDGSDDLLIGAPCVGVYNHGAAYVVLGPLTGAVALSDSDAAFVGDEDYEDVGHTVSDAGDVNADGYADLLVGADGDDDSTLGDETGAAFLAFGSIDWTVSSSSAPLKFTGEAGQDYAGYSVSGAGDVDADGYDDLLIGANVESADKNDEGAVYLILGPVSGDQSLSAADTKLVGAAAEDYAGFSVSGAGDVNADGLADVLIGANGEDSGGELAGAAYLVLGGGY